MSTSPLMGSLVSYGPPLPGRGWSPPVARFEPIALDDALGRIHDLAAVHWDRDGMQVPDWTVEWTAAVWDGHVHATLGHGCVVLYGRDRGRLDQAVLGPDLRWSVQVRIPSATHSRIVELAGAEPELVLNNRDLGIGG